MKPATSDSSLDQQNLLFYLAVYQVPEVRVQFPGPPTIKILPGSFHILAVFNQKIRSLILSRYRDFKKFGVSLCF